MPTLRRSATPFAVALILVVGTIVRLRVAGQSIFADELSTYWIVSTRGLGDVLSVVHSNAEITPPLSFVASWLTTRVDTTPELLRLPSLVAGIATIGAVYLVGRRTVGQGAAVVAAALTALSPFMIYYSAEARGYGLMMALVTLSTLTMLKGVDDRQRRWWIFYGVLTCAAVYTHYTSVFVLAAQLTWLLWTHPEARRAALVANAAATVAYLPWLTGLVKDLNSPTTEILSALAPFTPGYVRVSLVHWLVGYPYSTFASARELPGTPALAMLALAVVVAAAGIAVGRRARGRGHAPPRAVSEQRIVLVLGLALATPVAEAMLTAVGTNLFSTRNLAASWPGFALAFAAMLVAAGPRLRIVTAALAIGAFAIGTSKLFDDSIQRPQYEQAAHFIDRNARTGDVVVDGTAEISPGPLSHIDPFIDRPQRVFRASQPQERDHPFTVSDPVVPAAQAVSKAAAAARGGRVFVISGTPGTPIPSPRGYRVLKTRRYDGIVKLVVRVYSAGVS